MTSSGDAPVRVSLIGSTGSIGTQAIEVIEACPERFDVVALGAHRSVDLLADQAHRLRPEVVAIGDAGSAVRLLEGGGERAELELVAREVRALLDGGMMPGEIAVPASATRSG